jgi:2,4-dienoyl-CoA reductase-like NADH-dependent reductase (Old Yellow Enzyme family)
MVQLFTFIAFRSLSLPERLVVSRVCRFSRQYGHASGCPPVRRISRAVGQASLFFGEVTAMRPAGRITPPNLSLWDEAHVPAGPGAIPFRPENPASEATSEVMWPPTVRARQATITP